MKRKIVLAGMGLVVLSSVYNLPAQEMRVQVSPASIPGIDHEHTHNLTIPTLERGDTKFRLGGVTEDTHILNLSQRQVQDLLSGTTVIVDTGLDPAGGLPPHIHRLTITRINVATQQQESSGW